MSSNSGNNGNDSSDDREVARSVTSALDKAAEELAPDVLTRLQHARRQALAAMPAAAPQPAEQNGWDRFLQWLRRPRWMAAASGLAAILAVVIVLLIVRPGSGLNSGPEVDTMELIVQDQDLEFFDDIGFYQWMAEQKPNAS